MAPKYTVLPWMENLSAGYIVSVCIVGLFAWMLIEKMIKKYNTTMRRGTLAILSNTLWPLILNTCAFTVAYWQYAIPLSIGCAAVFCIIIRGELRTAREEELEGARGLSKELRELRSEAFSDLSIEEQMEYKANVKHQKCIWWIWAPCVIILPFLAVLLLEQLGVGDYLFAVHYFE